MLEPVLSPTPQSYVSSNSDVSLRLEESDTSQEEGEINICKNMEAPANTLIRDAKAATQVLSQGINKPLRLLNKTLEKHNPPMPFSDPVLLNDATKNLVDSLVNDKHPPQIRSPTAFGWREQLRKKKHQEIRNKPKIAPTIKQRNLVESNITHGQLLKQKRRYPRMLPFMSTNKERSKRTQQQQQIVHHKLKVLKKTKEAKHHNNIKVPLPATTNQFLHEPHPFLSSSSSRDFEKFQPIDLSDQNGKTDHLSVSSPLNNTLTENDNKSTLAAASNDLMLKEEQQQLISPTVPSIVPQKLSPNTSSKSKYIVSTDTAEAINHHASAETDLQHESFHFLKTPLSTDIFESYTKLTEESLELSPKIDNDDISKHVLETPKDIDLDKIQRESVEQHPSISRRSFDSIISETKKRKFSSETQLIEEQPKLINGERLLLIKRESDEIQEEIQCVDFTARFFKDLFKSLHSIHYNLIKGSCSKIQCVLELEKLLIQQLQLLSEISMDLNIKNIFEHYIHRCIQKMHDVKEPLSIMESLAEILRDTKRLNEPDKPPPPQFNEEEVWEVLPFSRRSSGTTQPVESTYCFNCMSAMMMMMAKQRNNNSYLSRTPPRIHYRMADWPWDDKLGPEPLRGGAEAASISENQKSINLNEQEYDSPLHVNMANNNRQFQSIPTLSIASVDPIIHEEDLKKNQLKEIKKNGSKEIKKEIHNDGNILPTEPTYLEKKNTLIETSAIEQPSEQLESKQDLPFTKKEENTETEKNFTGVAEGNGGIKNVESLKADTDNDYHDKVLSQSQVQDLPLEGLQEIVSSLSTTSPNDIMRKLEILVTQAPRSEENLSLNASQEIVITQQQPTSSEERFIKKVPDVNDINLFVKESETSDKNIEPKSDQLSVITSSISSVASLSPTWLETNASAVLQVPLAQTKKRNVTASRRKSADIATTPRRESADIATTPRRKSVDATTTLRRKSVDVTTTPRKKSSEPEHMKKSARRKLSKIDLEAVDKHEKQDVETMMSQTQDLSSTREKDKKTEKETKLLVGTSDKPKTAATNLTAAQLLKIIEQHTKTELEKLEQRKKDPFTQRHDLLRSGHSNTILKTYHVDDIQKYVYSNSLKPQKKLEPQLCCFKNN